MKSSIPKKYKLNNGNYIPTVGLGTYYLPQNKTKQIVYEACKIGYKHFDTAVLYENEKEVGEGISQWLNENPEVHKRESIFYTTKLWNNQCGYNEAKYAIKECLNKVKGLGYIDLLLIHSPLAGSLLRLETYRAMQEAVEEGIVKNIGVSNYGKHHIEELLNWSDLKIKPVVNQIEISPWLMRQELADYCKSRELIVEAYAPLTHGYKIKHPDVLKVAEECNVTPGQILIRWSLQHGYVPLPKTATLHRLKENLDVYGFELSDEQMLFLDHPNSYDPTDWECTDAP
ncbi:aldo-keto reductase superfamily protein SCDLUD_000094 [Saccharomycodes ludwigii]|uniref:aldo-keto reductase superfamily protein n=1 Tax=Saccharomycodes ludwigii TaxID=36035 RepID=UPI001E86A47A|nr:hypothetical protein SCDLUD_000094 [Saccharomycodes ludwigii]KAH3902516.1 hypothetical protein SCDLUD_000094 [Saccharomycodes ludwigii]